MRKSRGPRYHWQVPLTTIASRDVFVVLFYVEKMRSLLYGFEHRRKWIEVRLRELAQIFVMDLEPNR